MTISIDADFDGGNIRVMSADGNKIDLEIAKDRQSDFYQWFYFHANGLGGEPATFRILNAGSSAYPMGWPGFSARATTDREEWKQIPTRYDDGVLSFAWAGGADEAWFAYFEPYPWSRHEALIDRFKAHDHEVIGTTYDGRPIDKLTIGTGPKAVWLYARQHPGEPMAEWWMEGALEWLTGDSAEAEALKSKATLHIVPNMNPDGTVRGHLRTNALGVNLNREWHAPSEERSPEVKAVRDAMDRTGVVVAMDVHGDEAIPANFLAGFEGIPNWSDAQGEQFYDYARRLEAATPDFQTAKGYEKSKPGKANLSMSTNQLAERYGAVSMTLEMPFKDHDPNPDPVHGWDGARSKQLAVACLETLARMIDEIEGFARS